MQSNYYHGLTGGSLFCDEQIILKESLRILKSIFDCKALYCRRILKQKGVIVPDYKDPVYNGDDYISICIDNPPDEEFSGENWDLTPSFDVYVRKKIAIKFKSSIEQECIFRKFPYKRLPGERQIYEKIDISHFDKIIVDLDYLQNEALEEIYKICSPYKIPVIRFNELDDIDTNQKILCKF